MNETECIGGDCLAACCGGIPYPPINVFICCLEICPSYLWRVVGTNLLLSLREVASVVQKDLGVCFPLGGVSCIDLLADELIQRHVLGGVRDSETDD